MLRRAFPHSALRALAAGFLLPACSLGSDVDALGSGAGAAGAPPGEAGGGAGEAGAGGTGGAAGQGAAGGATAGAGGGAGAGGAGARCGNGAVEGDEACDSGLPEGNAACSAACEVLCGAPEAEGFVDEATGHCYLLFRAPSPWEAAGSRCRALVADGGDLVAMGDEREFEFVRSELADAIKFDAEIWTGGNDLDLEGTFAWANGEPFALDGWGWNAPAQPSGQPGQNCVLARPEVRFLMSDAYCDTPFPSLCERAPPGR